jgi:hypothetical protein
MEIKVQRLIIIKTTTLRSIKLHISQLYLFPTDQDLEKYNFNSILAPELSIVVTFLTVGSY